MPQQVDWHLVRAEMNGLDFDHRVRRPWASNPAFYVTVFPSRSDQPAREGPFALGAVEVWAYTFPLSPADAERMRAGLRTIPKLLEQAKTNLTGDGQGPVDLRRAQHQAAERGPRQLAARLTDAPDPLKSDVRRANEATDAFAAWLDVARGVQDRPVRRRHRRTTTGI